MTGYDLARSYAYSDSVTDVPMLEVVGHPHAVNPDKELRKIATAQGWPILVFDKPVALRQPDATASSEAHARRSRGRRGGRRRHRDRGRTPQAEPCQPDDTRRPHVPGHVKP